MGVLIDTNRQAAIKIDVDAVMIQDAIDANLSDYLKLVVADASGIVRYQAKAGDHRFEDIDDTNQSDVLRITCDDADGSIKQSTSQITDGNIWEIQATGTISGASVTVDIDYIHLDLDALVLNDGAANAITLQGINIDWDGITATAVGLSAINGFYMTLPSAGEYNAERGLQIVANKDVVSNNAIALDTSRDAGGTLLAAESFTNYANIMGQEILHSGGDFIFTNDEGILQLNLNHSVTVATASAPDVFSATALDINITADVNIGTSNAQCDTSARALDISYAISESDGVMRLAATDIARIVYTGAAGLTSAAGFEFNMLKLDSGASTLNDANISFRCIDLELVDTVDTDFAVFYGINIDMPVAYQGTDPTSAIHATGNDMTIDILHEGDFGIELETDVQDASNALLPIYITKDLNITVAHADGGTLTNSGNTVDVTIDTYSLDTTPATSPNNTSAVGLHVYQRHRQGNANDVGNIDELFTGASLDIDQILTINNTNGTTPSIVTTAPFIDLDLDVTETAGDVEIGAVDWISLSVDGGTVASAAAVKMIAFDSDIILNHASAEFYGFELDTTGMTNTLSQADSVGGLFINDDGILDYGIKLTNATDILKIMDTENSRGIYLDMETATSIGLYIDADKGVTANDLIALQTTRDMVGALTATSFTNYANIMGQSMIHSSNDAIATNDEGILQLVLNHDVDYVSTNADVFSATALNIAVTCDMDDANADLDVTARAIDISYALSRSSAGAHNLDAVDIFRINFDVAAGCAIGDGGAGNVNMILLDGDGVIPGATISNNMSISGMMIDWSAASMNDANASLFGLYIDMPVAAHNTAAIVEGIRILGDTPSAHNDVIGITISKDLVNTAAGAPITQTNNALNVSSVNTNAEAQVMTISNTLVDFTVSNAAAAAGADVYAGTILNIDYSAETDTSGTATSSATGLLIDYNLTETAATLTLDDFNVMYIDYDTVGTPTVGDGNYNLLYINGADAAAPAYGNVTFSGINIDISGIDVTDTTLTLYGAQFTIPNTVGIAVERAAVSTTDGVHTAKLSDGSMGISALGITDNKYYKCEDFDEEAAAVTLAAGLRGGEWVSAGLNDAAGNATYIQDQGGVLQIDTNGADDDSHEITWLNTVVNTGSNPILEFRVQIDSIGANLSGFFVGITETNDIQTINDISAVSDDYFVVGMNSDLGTPADLRCWGENANGGQVLTQLTGETVAATTWITIRMDFTDITQPRVWINHTGGAISADDEIAAALITQTVQDNIYVMPVIFVNGLDVTPSARTLLVDYMKIWQSRS